MATKSEKTCEGLKVSLDSVCCDLICLHQMLWVALNGFKSYGYSIIPRHYIVSVVSLNFRWFSATLMSCGMHL